MEKTDQGTWALKRNSDYYYQIQGNLSILNKERCYLLVYSIKGWLEVEEILIDNDLWENVMLPKLTR